jgi:hypothetical protein
MLNAEIREKSHIILVLGRLSPHESALCEDVRGGNGGAIWGAMRERERPIEATNVARAALAFVFAGQLLAHRLADRGADVFAFG